MAAARQLRMLGMPTPAFDVCGPLPQGMTLLQASAGTGKTFTIAALTARYVAEQGLPIERLLVITFTRMATGELRERVRGRLVSACEGLTAHLEDAGAERFADDEIVQLLARGSKKQVVQRRDRLSKAIADFDAATIETTHGFCLQVLYGLGTAGDVDREVTLVEDVSDLLEEVIDDLYLRKFAHQPNPLGFTRAHAKDIARNVFNHPDAAIVPEIDDVSDLPAIRRRFADAVRIEMERRKRALKILTYDDVLVRLRETLRTPGRGPVACERLRDRFDVVLVDEFQDTDPVQWDIMHRAFGQSPTTTLVLIGDPKQAIYAFRGADVHAYLEAADTVSTESTLDVNWRSDAGLLEAYDAFFDEAQLGHHGIAYRKVQAAAPNREPRLVGAPVAAPLRLRVLDRDDGLVPLTKKGEPVKADARRFIAEDVAAEVVALLEARPRLIRRRRDGSELDCRPLHPGDLAVLVRVNSHAAIVRDALHTVGVPAVIGGTGSVFTAPAATEWLRLLEALERPTSRERAAAAALTCFVGWTPERVADAADEEWESLHWSLHRWAALLRDQGVASMYEAVSQASGVPAQVLSRSAGERFMTDVRHIAQLLHEAGVSEGLGPNAMATWLGRRMYEASGETESEERTRRLESDAAAVQVITVHRSKGLEFPVVLCPYFWDGHSPESKVPVFHDAQHGGRRTIDVGQDSVRFPRHQQMELVESRGEDLRLMYVALTRAQHQAIVWWAGPQDSQQSPLARLLFERGSDGSIGSHGSRRVKDADVEAAFRSFGPQVSVERLSQVPRVQWQPDAGALPELEASVFDRTLDISWRRMSYSSITRSVHEPPAIGSEPEQPLLDDEEVMPVGASVPEEPSDDEALRAIPLALAAMPGGTLVGTVVHAVLERTDFGASELALEVGRALDAEMAWHNVELGDRETVVSGLCSAIELPLGPMVGGVRLRDIGRADRLDELGFELPMVGGERPIGTLSMGDLADVLEAELAVEDPVRAYAPRLRATELTSELRGYLNGSLDLVMRLPDGRYLLADYKTNRLGGIDDELTAWHYRPDALAAEMEQAHYPLQALLYSVALHRYLRWRLPGYDAEHHLGGVLYLFLRGMSAAASAQVRGQPCGVWSWRPPARVVGALSDLFDRGRS